MDIIRFSISRPVTVAVGVILTVMFGLIGLGAIPIQLTPTVDRPVITVTTNWAGRSPEEVVDNITREQEKRLKNVSNLKRMKSTSREGMSEITLEFYIGSDISRALQEVSDSLRQVPQYPAEVDEPLIKAADGASGPENAIAWIIIDIDREWEKANPWFDITTIYDSLDKEVKPFLERIDGVAEVNIYGGREREVRVMLDPTRLAQRRLTYVDVIEALRAENRNVSAGTIAEGKRDQRVRVVGQFTTEDDVMNTIIAYREGRPVYVHDVGVVEFGHQKMRGFVRSGGHLSLAMNVIRQSNANVVEVMADVRERLDDVATNILPKLGGEAGPHLRMRQVYDETTYIDSAIGLVQSNLLVGGTLAALVLLVFLRSFIATGIIALAIPVSVIGTFLAMVAFGRTINVVSLAGLAFATGMVVDNAIVVLENTVRRRNLGNSRTEAAYWGGKEVWGALVASTLTTVAVFIPILTIQEEAGQLFRDISLAIACAVALSLVVSITVIPSLCALMLPDASASAQRSALRRAFDNLFGLAPVAAGFSRRLGDFTAWMIAGWRAWSVRLAVIGLLATASLLGSYLLMPPMDYLPPGNRNLVFGGMLIPPGYSVEQQAEVARRLETVVQPYYEADIKDQASVAALPPIMRFEPGAKPFDPVPVDQYFIGSFNGGMFAGATSQDENRVRPVGNLLTMGMNMIPDTFGGAAQASIFGRGGSGNTVDLEISGPDLGRVTAAAGMMFGMAMQTWPPGANLTPSPSNFNLTQPETRIRVNRLGRELGLTSRDVGVAVRALFDGAFVDDFRLGSDTVDMVVLPLGVDASGRLEYKEQIETIPIATPAGPVVPLASVVEIIQGQAPQEIQRLEELASVTLQIRPLTGDSVEATMRKIRETVLGPAEAAGMVDATMRIRLEGTAAALDDVRASLLGRAHPDAPIASWQRGVLLVSGLLLVAGLAVGVYMIVRAVLLAGVKKVAPGRPRSAAYAYGAAGVILLSLVVAGFLGGFAWQPQLTTARFIWALLVTYLLMCALFEHFLYPLVIMFSVPLAVVGGFLGLRIVYNVTLLDPTKAPQLLDVITMLGFVVLIGTVVNNAILLVEQALNFMNPARYGGSDAPMEPRAAIAEAVRTRVRPIFMTTCTTVGGMLPLAAAPGAGSEMYRGLGAVILGGMIVSTAFTLLLVPLMLSLVMDMQAGVRAVFGLGGGSPTPPPTGPMRGTPAERSPGCNGKAPPVAVPAG